MKKDITSEMLEGMEPVKQFKSENILAGIYEEKGEYFIEIILPTTKSYILNIAGLKDVMYLMQKAVFYNLFDVKEVDRTKEKELLWTIVGVGVVMQIIRTGDRIVYRFKSEVNKTEIDAGPIMESTTINAMMQLSHEILEYTNGRKYWIIKAGNAI